MTQKQIAKEMKRIGTDRNPDGVNLKKLKDRDKGKVPLQISKTLTILVRPEKATPEYAEEYRKKMEYSYKNNW